MIKKIKTIFKIIIVLIILWQVFNVAKYFIAKNNHVNVKGINVNLYINTADDASKGKVQVNWKELAAIDGVRYKNDFSKVDKEKLKQLADMFVAKNTSGNNIGKSNYKLVNLDEILDKLSFEKKEKEKVHKYLEDLKFVALNSHLIEDSSYGKFIDELTPQAIEIYNKYGVLPSITISQAILESGWGKSELTSKGNNLFGIKADSSWKGNHIVMKTSEYYNKIINDSFRAYASKGDSLKDYGKFLSNNRRYKEKGVFSAIHYTEQAKAIEKAGYSTKEDKQGNQIYADLIITIVKENNLQLIDNKVQAEKSRLLTK